MALARPLCEIIFCYNILAVVNQDHGQTEIHFVSSGIDAFHYDFFDAAASLEINFKYIKISC